LLTAPEIAEIFQRFATANPEPKGELEFSNPFTLVVAVVLSAQATDAGVNKATRGLFAQADTPEKMLALGEDAVREHVKTIGLFRAKSKNVILLSEKLIREFGGEVPQDRDALETLPGVGRKTANVVRRRDDGGRYARAAGFEPHRSFEREDPARRRSRSQRPHSGRVRRASPSLVDPARALCLQGPETGVPGLPHPRHLPVSGQDARLERRPARTPVTRCQPLRPTNAFGLPALRGR
jgi:hypothetical protein